MEKKEWITPEIKEVNVKNTESGLNDFSGENATYHT